VQSWGNPVQGDTPWPRPLRWIRPDLVLGHGRERKRVLRRAGKEVKLFHSNGMGVQSVTIAAMMCLGDLPRAEVSIFADPQWESAATYDYRDWFVGWAWGKHRFEVVTATGGNLRADAIAGTRGGQMPFYSKIGDEGGM